MNISPVDGLRAVAFFIISVILIGLVSIGIDLLFQWFLYRDFILQIVLLTFLVGIICYCSYFIGSSSRISPKGGFATIVIAIIGLANLVGLIRQFWWIQDDWTNWNVGTAIIFTLVSVLFTIMNVVFTMATSSRQQE